jgi:gliding motility-associated-like protein
LNTTSVSPVISSGPQASNVFANLGVGTYTITVSDGWGCSATSSAPIVIAEPTIVTASLVVATTQTCTNPAALTLSAVGGTPPYTYSADGLTYNATTFNSSLTVPVAVGTHRYYVKDANGCTSVVSNDIQIDPLPALTIKLDLFNALVNCAGDATGVIVATAKGGLGNYVYTLQDASGNTLPAAVQSSPGIFTQLVAGGYKVQVSSLDCIATSALITVTEPSRPLVATFITTDATCNGANNGTITINASGGTGTIKYAISPRLDQFFVSNVFELLQPGFYEIIAQDQNGCYVHTVGIEIKEPALIIPSVNAATIIEEVCFGDKDGAFTIDITGGTLPYSVSLDKINGPFTLGTATQTQFDFTGLAGGHHTVYIRDANLCNAEIMIPLPASVKLIPNAIVDYGCLNNAPSNTVTVKIDPSITNLADVDYALDGSSSYQASNVFTNVSPGIHHITARHTNGCEKNTPDFEILKIDPLKVVLNNGGLNELVATTTGGSGFYQYTFNGESTGTKNTFIIYETGNYTVDVVDSEGCRTTDTKSFTFIDIDIPNVFTPDGDGTNDNWGPTKTTNYPDLTYHIFDRYGRKIATYREGQFWDGKYNGFELPSGDYWYTLKLNNDKDEREFVGHFTLYR